jgi:hypothetical protein
VQLHNTATLNELRQGFTFGSSLTFDVRLDGDALSLPSRGRFGSTFALLLLGPDGRTPLATTAPDGSALRVTIAPDGSTQFLGADGAHAAAANTVTVADAPLQAALVPIQAIEGIPFTSTVATFTDANPNAPAADFTASILWGDGTAASEGTILADGGGRFHVVGRHTFVEAGNYAISVVVRDRGGSAVSAAGAPLPLGVTGLQAPRVAFVSGFIESFAAGDFNGDGKPDLAVWGGSPTTNLPTLYVLLVLQR